ncbi:MAG: hypothetical protein BroJett025_09500 [Patescibacteria group bacterium]|nr:MAG: hypothetical protein BroJett025_09500 [Patescibacteria group bacterium]
MEEFKTKEKFVILDGHAIIYRAYHALKELTDPTGMPINAVYGFAKILLKVINDYDPKYIAVAFDHKNGKSKRVADFDKYKAQRPPMPDDLVPQISIIKDLVTAFNIPQFEIDGFEADDLLGTIADEVKQQGSVQTIIVTGDKDILQLVEDDSTHVFIPGRGKFSKDREYDEAGVAQRMGVTPEQIPDLKALMGDPSDNIPGVKGIGEKTAVKLIQEFKTLDHLYEVVEELEKQETAGQSSTNSLVKGAVLKKLIADKDMAFLSKKLATIQHDAPVSFELEKCVTKNYDKDMVSALFEKYKFNSLKGLLPKDEFEEAVQEALF